MCILDKKYTIELRSEDAESNLAPGVLENTYVKFKGLDFRGFLREHPMGDNGLWNVKVVYFGLQQQMGIDSCEAIDISIDEISSPYTLSTRNYLTLGTANCDYFKDIDNTSNTEFVSSAYYIDADESLTQTCRIKFSNWNVRILPQRKESGDFTSLGGDSAPNTISNWVLRLQLNPYDPRH